MVVFSGWIGCIGGSHNSPRRRATYVHAPVVLSTKMTASRLTSFHGADLVIPSHASVRYVERRSRCCSINLHSRQPPSASRRTRCPKIHGNGTPPPPLASRARPDDADRRRRGEGAQGRRRKKRIERRPSRPGGRRGGSFSLCTNRFLIVTT